MSCSIHRHWIVHSPNHEFLGICDDHHPVLSCRIPDNLWISELSAVDRYDGIIGILGEGIASVGRVSKLLSLSQSDPRVLGSMVKYNEPLGSLP